jgi:hypothetical protein
MISLIENLYKFSDTDFISDVVCKIQKFFESEHYNSENFKFAIKVFRKCIKHGQETNSLVPIIKSFIKRYFMLFENGSSNQLILQNNTQVYANLTYDYLIEDFSKISRLLKLNNENNFLTDFFNYLLKTLFENSGSNSLVLSKSRDFTFSFNENIDYKTIFYKNLHKFFKVKSKQMVNKYLSFKLFEIFEENNKTLLEIVWSNFSKIFISQMKCDNEEFFNKFLDIFSKFEECLNEVKDWRVMKNVLESLYFIDYLFKSQNDDFSNKYLNFIKKQSKSINFQIQNEAIRHYTKIFKYSKNKSDLLKYIDAEIFYSKCFYKRRLYFQFFFSCLELFSIKFIKEKGIIDNLLKFFDDNFLFLNKLLTILPTFFPLINDDTRLKFVVMNKLENLRKGTKIQKDKEIKIVSLLI